MSRKKRERLQALADAVEHASSLSGSVDTAAIGVALTQVRRAYIAAADIDWDAALPGLTMIKALEVRLKDLGRLATAAERKTIEDLLRPCGSCRGRTFRVSAQLQLQGLGRVRVALCTTCGAMTMFAANPADLTGMGSSLELGPPITISGDDHPFR
jgi:hypothetical protein